MGVEWEEASASVLSIARTLIDDYHSDLEDAKIGFVFRSEASSSGGFSVLGHASKVSGQLRALLDFDFIIWLAKDVYERMDENYRMALIDHELCHCTIIDGEAKMVHHDVEEFKAVIGRWGLWDATLLSAAPAFKKAMQLELGLQMLETREHSGSIQAISPTLMLSTEDAKNEGD